MASASNSFAFDTSDLAKFSSVAQRQAVKKGTLFEKYGITWKKKLFALFGNLLYKFDADDTNKSIGVEFMEYSNVRACAAPPASADAGVAALSISTVGGRTITLSFASAEERDDWLAAIEGSKFMSLSRRLEDSEAASVQLHHRVEQQEIASNDLEQNLLKWSEEAKQLHVDNEKQEGRLRELTAEASNLKIRLRELEAEKNILLRSRGITPKKVPLWALNNAGDVNNDSIDSLRIWCGSWNLSGHEPLGGLEKSKAHALMRALIPSNDYDVYVLAIQEAVSDSLIDCLDGLLGQSGLQRLALENFTGNLSTQIANGSHHAAGSGDRSRLFVRGDGPLQFQKFIGLAVYAHRKIFSDTNILNVASKPFLGSSSRGAVAAAISILGRSFVFISAQLDSKSKEFRRNQCREIATDFGDLLGEREFHLNEQFHHIICLGDFGSPLVDTSGLAMPADTTLKMLEDGLARTLFESHDELNKEKKAQQLFYKYREPCPYPNFFPTYRKIENRLTMDFSSSNWVRSTYDVVTKQPFFKGGATKECPPSFTDRILFHSMVDLAEDLVPEALPQDMIVHLNEADVASYGGFGISKSASFSSGQYNAGSFIAATPPRKGGSLAEGATLSPPIAVPNAVSQSSRLNVSMKEVVIDNYRTVNDGEIMNVSSHSPVYSTFLLRLRHDHEDFRNRPMASMDSIGNVLHALHDTNGLPVAGSSFGTSPRDRQLLGMSPLSYAEADLNRRMQGGVAAVDDKSSSQLALSLQQPAKKVPPTGASGLRGIGIGGGFSNPTEQSRTLRGYRYCLLPPAQYTIRVSNFKLIWGNHEEMPSYLKLLFPAPYETVNGETFTDFFCETCGAAGNTPVISKPVKSCTPMPSSRQSNRNSMFSGEASMSASQAAQTGKDVGLESFPSDCADGFCWRRACNSNTGTSFVSEASCPSTGVQVKVPSLQLTWKGDEPLDRLHLVIRAGMTASSFSTASISRGDEQTEWISGHCSVGLERLCKVAMVHSGGVSGKTNTAQLLLKDGLPLHRVDQQTLLREQVTLYFELELLPAVSNVSL